MADRRLYKRRFAECVAVCAAAALSLAAAYSFFALRHLSDVCEMERSEEHTSELQSH